MKTQCARQDQIARVEAEFATKSRQVELNAQWEMLSAKQQVRQARPAHLGGATTCLPVFLPGALSCTVAVLIPESSPSRSA